MVKNNTFENFVLLSLQSTVGQTKNFQAKRTKSHNIWSAIIFGSAPSLRRTTGSPRFADFKLVPARALVPWRWPKGTRLWGRDCRFSPHLAGTSSQTVASQCIVGFLILVQTSMLYVQTPSYVLFFPTYAEEHSFPVMVS